jgi:non-ribosomal peptide synthetase component F
VTYGLSQTPQVWIDAQAEEQDEVLLLVWDAVEALFPEGMLADMFHAYVGLLQRLVTDPSAWTEPAGPLVPATHLAQRAAVNATQAPLSQEMLHTLFLAQVEKCADAPAVIAPDRSLTYQHLYQQACQVGHWLRAAGAIPNTLVAVVMEPGWEQVVAVLGILMSGAAYLPIDPELPTERQHYLLAQGQVSLALTQSHLILSWPENIQRLAVDTAQLPDQGPLDIVQKPTDLAYVVWLHWPPQGRDDRPPRGAQHYPGYQSSLWGD